MADKRLIPDGIRDLSTEAFNELIDRLGTLDLTPLLVYLIDNVSVSALPHLAEQFHVAGPEGWDLTRTEAEKRGLIKRAIELHRHKGTPWAVKEAIKSIGYHDAAVEERLPTVKYDGSHTHAGTEDYLSGARWALFRVLIDTGETKSLTASDIRKLTALINEYKNARSHLKDITFKSTAEDRFDALIDSLSSIITGSYEDIKPWGLRYDGSILHSQADRRLFNGNLLHNGQAEYGGWNVTGKRHDNEWDLPDTTVLGASASDGVCITPLYNERLCYSGFTYGSDAPFAIDAAMPLTIAKHIRHDGRYNHGGIYYNNAFQYDAGKAHFGGVYYAGDVISREGVI